MCGSAGIATGAAFSAKWRGTDQVVAMFFGEGALGQGVLYEVMNMASLWKLPIIYVCEDNLYNEYTHFTETTAGQILARPRAFDIHAVEVNGQDVRAVYQTMVGRSSGPGAVKARHFCCATPIAIAGTMSAILIAAFIERRKKSRCG